MIYFRDQPYLIPFMITRAKTGDRVKVWHNRVFNVATSAVKVLEFSPDLGYVLAGVHKYFF